MRRLKVIYYDDPVLVGRRLREARETAGWSQRELSFPGCTAAYISRIEKGERVPSLQLVREFVGELNSTGRVRISEEWLCHGNELGRHTFKKIDRQNLTNLPGYLEVAIYLDDPSDTLKAFVPVLLGYRADAIEMTIAELDVNLPVWEGVDGISEFRSLGKVDLPQGVRLAVEAKVVLAENTASVEMVEAKLAELLVSSVLAYATQFVAAKSAKEAIEVFQGKVEERLQRTREQLARDQALLSSLG